MRTPRWHWSRQGQAGRLLTTHPTHSRSRSPVGSARVEIPRGNPPRKGRFIALSKLCSRQHAHERHVYTYTPVRVTSCELSRRTAARKLGFSFSGNRLPCTLTCFRRHETQRDQSNVVKNYIAYPLIRFSNVPVLSEGEASRCSVFGPSDPSPRNLGVEVARRAGIYGRILARIALRRGESATR